MTKTIIIPLHRAPKLGSRANGDLERFTEGIHVNHHEEDLAVAEPSIDEPLLADADLSTYSDYQLAKKPKRKKQPRYHVILWDDADHSYDYVVLMMKELFAHPIERGFQIAKQVDRGGRAICLTTTMEHAELKRDQIHAFGKDELIARCKGSMSATIEPVPSDD